MQRFIVPALFLFTATTPVGTAATSAAAQSTARITGIQFGPVPADGGGLAISVVGSGRCTYTIDFGDGTTERRTADLPDRLEHGYEPDRDYEVVATPERPCEGVARARLELKAIEEGIWRLTVEPGPATDAPEVIVNVEGRGTCTVLIDFGDGERRKLEGALPAKVSHTYGAPGTYEVYASAESPCRGDVRMKVDVRR